MEQEQECWSCIFYLREDDENGWCRRHPPVIVESMINKGISAENALIYATRFPSLSAFDWCGEYKCKNND